MPNQAIDVNPPFAPHTITTGGSDWLWAATAFLLFTDLGMVFLTLRQPKGQRTFHSLAVIILTIASVGYFSMASDLGGTDIIPEFRNEQGRAVWYVRYIMWTLDAPLLALEVLFLSGLPLSEVFMTSFMVVFGVVMGLVGALVHSSYKWGYYTFGLGALSYIWYAFLFEGPQSARLVGQDVQKIYIRCAAYLAFLWTIFPISWALSEGANVITPNGEMIFYGVLDILSKPVFLYFLTLSIRKVDYSRFGWVLSNSNAAHVIPEKAAATA